MNHKLSHTGAPLLRSELQGPHANEVSLMRRLPVVLTPGPGELQGVLGSSILVLESRGVCWAPHSWSWRAVGCAGVLTPGEPQGVLGSSLLVLESRRVCWGPHSWSWRGAGCAGVLTPGPGGAQGVLGSSLLVLESHRVCWGPHSWSLRSAGCALYPKHLTVN